MTAENTLKKQYKQCSITHGIALEIANFKAHYHYLPSLVCCNVLLKGPFTREVSREMLDDLGIVCKVHDPFYLDGVPVVFTVAARSEIYVRCQHLETGVYIDL